MPDGYGVINEQGFVLGTNLGFKPLNEEESKSVPSTENKEADSNGK